mmetsp:Transcript_92206/g.192804  ORF Transcript_92206/g.192804 Transcript_92206/m.192804 type:complete len:599 (-) Transcript_92206:103-1899(-)
MVLLAIAGVAGGLSVGWVVRGIIDRQKERYNAPQTSSSQAVVVATAAVPDASPKNGNGTKPAQSFHTVESRVSVASSATGAGGSRSSRSRRGRAKRVYGLGGYSQSSRVMLCMVGLPARGKSYIVKMLQRYLQWSGFPVRIFNAGNLRRAEGLAGASADFFQDKNKEASVMREKVASMCMEEAIHWLETQTNVCVAIFDATNTTRKRRTVIVDRCRYSCGIIPVFIESICDNPAVLEENYKLKMGNDDYSKMDPVKAREDFLERVRAYEKRYETIGDDELGGQMAYIKLFNVGQKVVMHHCSGYLVSQIGFYLSNIHIQPRSIWLTRHAEFEDDTCHSDPTGRGRKYCTELAHFLSQRRTEMSQAGNGECAELLVLMGTSPGHATTFDLVVAAAVKSGDRAWSCHVGANGCSLMNRQLSGGGGGIDFASPPRGSLGLGDEGLPPLARSSSASSCESTTAQDFPAMSTSLLNELDRGDYNGVSYDCIQREHPEIWNERQRDALHFRYPGVGGESYADVIGRLRPIIIELERQRRSVLVISHLAVQRCLYAYFTGAAMEEIPHLEFPMHEVIELQPGPFGCKVTRVPLAEGSQTDRSPVP